MAFTDQEPGDPGTVETPFRFGVELDIFDIRETLFVAFKYPAFFGNKFVEALELGLSHSCLQIERHVFVSHFVIEIGRSVGPSSVVPKEETPFIKLFIVKNQHAPFAGYKGLCSVKTENRANPKFARPYSLIS